MEHKGLYRQGFASSPEPDKNYLLPFGKARIVQIGNDVTIVTWGAIVQKSIEAVRKLNIQADIIDIRTLNPLDMDTILNSIQKTNRVIIAHEDNLTGGFGGEIAAKIADKGFEFLDAPVKRVASKDIPIGKLLLFPGQVTHGHTSTELLSGTKYSLTIWSQRYKGDTL